MISSVRNEMIRKPCGIYYDKEGAFYDKALDYCFTILHHHCYMDEFILLRAFCGLRNRSFFWKAITTKEDPQLL
jgi:hypothetical protein